LSHDYNYILGLGVDFPFEGKVYRIADDLELGVAAAFERWMKRQAMQSAMDVADVDPGGAEQFREVFFKQSVGGAFRIESEMARKAILSNPDAQVELFYLLMENGRDKATGKAPEVDRRLAKRMLDDKVAGPWAMAMCLVALGLDPTNALTAAAGIMAVRAATRETQAQKKSSGDWSESILQSCQNSLSSVGGGLSASSLTPNLNQFQSQV